jgi:NitT/TauT family transport system ATP-binding protein
VNLATPDRRSAPLGEGVIFEHVSKRFGNAESGTLALADITLAVPRGQFVTLIGPSGCGKTTLLRIAAGLTVADSGEVAIFGETVDAATINKHIGFVPQAPALLPWRSVLENVRLPLQVNRRKQSGELRDPVEILAAFGLGHVLDMRPAQLSGGMQQRVAIARAFAFDPPLLLMDEPFSALDEFTREVLRHELLEVWEREQKTVIFVTHSVTEAVLLSDIVVVMSAQPGQIRAVVPVELARPRGDEIELTSNFIEVERRVRAELRGGWRQSANWNQDDLAAE